MYKILIVDDELLLRTNLKMMLNWEKLGFSICAEASNGLEALHFMKSELPDIVVSDIRMPVMNGLELIKEARAEYPEMVFVMLSNYDDFEYVRETLKNGAADYILKHNLNASYLMEVFSVIGKKLADTGKERRENLAEPISNNNLDAIRGKFVIQLLTGLYKNEADIKNHLTILDMKIETKNVVAILMVVDDYKAAVINGALKEASLMQFSICNIGNEILGEMGNGTISHVSNEKYVIILSFANKHSNAYIDNTITSILERMATCIKRFMNLSVSFCVGTRTGSIVHIAKSYEYAERLLDEKFFYGKRCVVKQYTQDHDTKPVTGLSMESERKILALIRNLDEKNLSDELLSIFKQSETEKLSIKSYKMIFNDLLGIINRICKEKHIEIRSIYSGDEAPDELISRLETLEDAKDWFLKAFRRVLSIVSSEAREFKSPYVKSTVDYIKAHFQENISLGQIADSLNISDVYLSKLFKEEAGIGFSEYLCDIRLEKAKLLLRDSREDTIKHWIRPF